MAEYVIGVDIGTQGVKAALFRAEDGQCLGQSFVPSALHQPAPGTVEEDPEFQLESACRAIAQAVRRAKVNPAGVAALALDGQMAGVIGVGADGHAVTPYDSWLDQRCAPQIRQMEAAAGDEILAKCGCAPSFNHGPKILRWKESFSQVYARIASFVQPAAYVAMRLCGLDGTQAFIDTTYLHFSGFADNPGARWDEGLCSRFGMDPARLPRIIEPWEQVGVVEGALARRCGLHPGTPVMAGCGDTAASFLACGAVRPGVCVDVAGTASVFAATAPAFTPDRVHRTLACGRAAAPGLWHPYAYINGGGLNLEWFRRELGDRKGAALTFAALNALAEEARPDEDSPLFIPHLGGRVCPSQAALRGGWIGLSWTHTRGHLYRAVLEAVALEYGIYQRILTGLNPGLRLREMRITGGGEQSAVWNQLKADVLGLPVARIERGGGAPLGAALVAALGAGLFKSLPRGAARWIATAAGAVRPQRRMREYYQRRLARYQALLEQFASIQSD